MTVWGAALFAAGLRADGRLGRRRPAPSPAAPPAPSPEASGAAGDRVRASLLTSPAALLLALAAGSLILFSLIHTSLIPIRAYDALVGYDLVGKIMAFEGKLRSTVFTRVAFNAQCVYGPFTSTNCGYWYLFHPPISRLWIPLIYGGFLLVYWSRIRSWTGSPTAASLASFLVLLPSSFAFQLTEAQTDTPCLVFTALALLALVDLLKGTGGLLPLSVFLLISDTARTENLLFGLACSAVLLPAPSDPQVDQPVSGPGPDRLLPLLEPVLRPRPHRV